MGEAKRRKQKLGDDYGKVPPVLTLGSQQLSKQVDQFMTAWFACLADLHDPSEDEDKQLSDEEIQVIRDKTAEWLVGYLEPYRIPDRHTLISGVLDPQFAELRQLAQSPQPTEKQMDRMQEWMLETLNLYDLFKPHFSKAQLKAYGDPLRGFYNFALEEAQKEEDQEKIDDLNLLFAPCLEP